MSKYLYHKIGAWNTHSMFNDLINITMTYRRDSNVLYGYEKMIPISNEAIKAYREGKWLPFDPSIIYPQR